MIYLLRHGEIEGSGEKRFIGHSDIPLNAKGKEQAVLWKSKLCEIKFDEIYSSDLIRCVETAKIISNGFMINLSKELREISLGNWDGMFHNHIREKFPEEWKARGKDRGFRPPGGESFFDLKNRVIPFFEKIIAIEKENILVVSHSGVIRTILCYCLNMSLERIFHLSQDYSAMNLIDNRSKPVQLVAMNLTL